MVAVPGRVLPGFFFSPVAEQEMKRKTLWNNDFLALCCITFLALCNTAVYFNLHPYLMDLGVTPRGAGFLIGIYSLSSMFFYAFAGHWITNRNCYRCMCLGLLILCACGNSYLFVTESLLIGLIRFGSGFGLFLAMASVMVVLVQLIPPEKTGIGFSVFSVAMLMPYSLMPAITEIASPLIERPPQMYAAAALLLLPAAGFALHRDRLHRAAACREKGRGELSAKTRKTTFVDRLSLGCSGLTAVILPFFHPSFTSSKDLLNNTASGIPGIFSPYRWGS